MYRYTPEDEATVRTGEVVHSQETHKVLIDGSYAELLQRGREDNSDSDDEKVLYVCVFVCVFEFLLGSLSTFTTHTHTIICIYA